MKQNVDTTIKLWDVLYEVSVPYFETRDLEDIRKRGIRLSGIKEIDDGVKTEWVKASINIDKMVEYFRQGVDVYISDIKDLEEIYKSVSEHVLSWKGLLERGINIYNAPLDDLILLDSFITKIYPQAKNYFSEENTSDELIESLFNKKNLNKETFFKNNSVKRFGDDKDGHDSYSDFFKNRKISNNGFRSYG